jgi:hypothetical protein
MMRNASSDCGRESRAFRNPAARESHLPPGSGYFCNMHGRAVRDGLSPEDAHFHITNAVPFGSPIRRTRRTDSGVLTGAIWNAKVRQTEIGDSMSERATFRSRHG